MLDAVSRPQTEDLHPAARGLPVPRAAAWPLPGLSGTAVDEARAEIRAIRLQARHGTLDMPAAGPGLQPACATTWLAPKVGDPHDHASCRAPGKVAHADGTVRSAPCLSPSANCGYEILGAEVPYWDIYPDCRAEAPKRGRPGPAKSTSPPNES